MKKSDEKLTERDLTIDNLRNQITRLEDEIVTLQNVCSFMQKYNEVICYACIFDSTI